MADDNSRIKQYYKEHFGFDVDKLSDEQKARLDKAIATTETAMAYPVQYVNGVATVNPAYQYLRENGIPRSTAQAMSLWQHYKAGIMPSELDRERLVKGGVPPEMADQMATTRVGEFNGRAPARYQMWERDEEQPAAKKSRAKIEMPEERVQGSPESTAPPAEAQPEQQQPEPQPLEPMQVPMQQDAAGNLWRMQQKTPQGWAPMDQQPPIRPGS